MPLRLIRKSIIQNKKKINKDNSIELSYLNYIIRIFQLETCCDQ